MRLFIISLFSFAVVFLAASLVFQISSTPSPRQVQSRFKSSDRIVLDRQGRLLEEIQSQDRTRRLDWVKLSQVSRAFQTALVQAEDRRFFYHPGFDPIALLRRWGGRTITMQLLELIESAGEKPVPRSGFWRTLTLMEKATALELAWNKREILEAYINLVYYQMDIQGIGAASFLVFKKAPAQLNRHESNLAAQMIHSSKGVVYSSNPSHPNLAMQVAQKLMLQPELKTRSLIRSTLDLDLQKQALKALQTRHVDGGLVVVENATGHVLAYVSHAGPAAKGPKSGDRVLAMRQAGVTLKPLIYAKAFDERILTPATMLEDSPLAISRTQHSKFNRPFKDLVSVRDALVSNLNIPAVRVLELLGVDTFVQTLRDLGFRDLETAEFYGPSLALGSADIRLLELTNGYRTLVNGGVWTQLRFSPEVPSDEAPRTIFTPEASFIAADILTDRQSPYWVAMKSGLSLDNRDSWCVGFSEKYTVGVRTTTASDVLAARQIWQEIVSHLPGIHDSRPPRSPEGIVQKGQEVFIRGTEPVEGPTLALRETASRISYPLNDTLIALDEHSTSERYRVFIQVVAPKSDQNLYLNDRRIGRARNLIPWDPQVGKFRLELRNAKGDVLDVVHFEVRGRRFALAN